MSLASQNPFRCSSGFKFRFSPSIRRRTLFSLPVASGFLTNLPQFHVQGHKLRVSHNSRFLWNCQYGVGDFGFEEVAQSGNTDGELNLDSLLSFSELLCIFSSTVFLVSFVVNFVGSSSKKALWVLIGDRGFVWGFPLLVAAVFLNTWIRRRQWRRICMHSAKGASKVNLLERIEKLEEDLRSSMTIIQVLSRKFEKLGISFRVMRKALKDPIAETAALAQRNFEATQTLAAQEDGLEKEMVEMQKVLLAMQEQQQKQLELIIAIGEKGKLMESKQEFNQEQTRIEKKNSANVGSKKLEAYEI